MKHKKFWIGFLAGVFALVVMAANPAFTDFVSSQFGVTGNKVSIKSGAIITNLVFSGHLLPNETTNALGSLSNPLTNWYSRGGTIVGTAPGRLNLTGTNGNINSIEAASLLSTGNVLRLPGDSRVGVLVLTNVVGTTNQMDVVTGGSAGQALYRTSIGYDWSNVVASSQSPWTSDINARGFAVTNLLQAIIGPNTNTVDTTPGSRLIFTGTNASGQAVNFRFRNTNSILFLDQSVNGAAWGNVLSLTSGGILGAASAINAGGNVTASGTIVQVAATGGYYWTSTAATHPRIKRTGAGIEIQGADGISSSSNNVIASGAVVGTNGLASYATDAVVAIGASGWTNTFTKNATVYIDGTSVQFVVYNNAGTPVYTNASLTANSTVPLQPGGKVIIVAGTGVTGYCTPW